MFMNEESDMDIVNEMAKYKMQSISFKSKKATKILHDRRKIISN